MGIHLGSDVVPDVVAYMSGLPGNSTFSSPCLWRSTYGRKVSNELFTGTYMRYKRNKSSALVADRIRLK